MYYECRRGGEKEEEEGVEAGCVLVSCESVAVVDQPDPVGRALSMYPGQNKGTKTSVKAPACGSLSSDFLSRKNREKRAVHVDVTGHDEEETISHMPNKQ